MGIVKLAFVSRAGVKCPHLAHPFRRLWPMLYVISPTDDDDVATSMTYYYVSSTLLRSVDCSSPRAEQPTSHAARPSFCHIKRPKYGSCNRKLHSAVLWLRLLRLERKTTPSTQVGLYYSTLSAASVDPIRDTPQSAGHRHLRLDSTLSVGLHLCRRGLTSVSGAAKGLHSGCHCNKSCSSSKTITVTEWRRIRKEDADEESVALLVYLDYILGEL